MCPAPKGGGEGCWPQTLAAINLLMPEWCREMHEHGFDAIPGEGLAAVGRYQAAVPPDLLKPAAPTISQAKPSCQHCAAALKGGKLQRPTLID